MVRGKDKVLDYFDVCCVPSGHLLWKICQGRNTNKIIASIVADSDSTEDDDTATKKNKVQGLSITAESSKERLNQSLSFLSPGDYVLICKSRPGQGKGQLETFFTIPESEKNAVGGMQTFQGGFMTEEQVMKRINDEKRLWESEREMAELKNMIKEMKSSTGDRRWDKFFDAVGPYVPQIVESFTGVPTAPVGVSGFRSKSEGKTEEQAAQEEKEWEKEVTEFIQTRPSDALELFKKMVKIAKDDPSKVELFKTML